jgi:CheY-like chemotaxis protein
LLTAVLAPHWAEVRVANGKAAALTMIAAWDPSVLVSDLGRPPGDGYELIREVRQWDAVRGVQLPAVALTGYARDEDRLGALAAGFQMYLTKPVEPDELIKAVASLTGKSKGGAGETRQDGR